MAGSFQKKNGQYYYNNSSPMFPVEIEKKVNALAGQEITEWGVEPMAGLWPGFVNSFVIKREFTEIFERDILPEVK